MSEAVPATVRQAWGDDVARDVSDWIEAVVTGRAAVGGVLDEVVTRLGNVEGALGDLRQEIVGVKTDLTDLRGAVVGVKADLTDLRGEVSGVKADLTEVGADVRNLMGNTRDLAQRFDDFSTSFSARLDAHQAATNERFDRLADRLDRHTQWSIALLGLFATIVTSLLAVETLLP